ncbi:MAG: site-2 protease family protein [Patescibacteria group bacterium]
MFSLLFQQPLLFVAWVIAFLIALSVHEFSHALVGNWLGDPTAKRMGRLTLNPAAHVDPIGLLAVIFIGFGWGKPVPFNPYNLTWPKWGPVAIASAGPLSNLILAAFSVILSVNLAPLLGENNLLLTFLVISAQLNVALCVFNLIPLPPLDGSKALLAFLASPQYASARIFIERQGSMLLFLLILLDTVGKLGIFSSLFEWGAQLLSLFARLPRIL